MNMRRTFLAACILAAAGILMLRIRSLTAHRTVFQYPETAVYNDEIQVIKTVYSPGQVKLYYRGEDWKKGRVRCYDTDFEDLGNEFTYSLRWRVLTIKADFADRISGLTIDDTETGTIRYHLRYLDSPQFAWMADILWLDDGWQSVGDADRYYSPQEKEAQAREEAQDLRKTMDIYALLKGTWVSEDGQCKFIFYKDEEADCMVAENLSLDESGEEWESWPFYSGSAYWSEYYDEDGEEDAQLRMITLVNTSSTAANMSFLYDREQDVFWDGDTAFHRE